ncbi:hypothetical protein RCL1_000939 [Eukaryota sp. TZLM3-RCL]
MYILVQFFHLKKQNLLAIKESKIPTRNYVDNLDPFTFCITDQKYIDIPDVDSKNMNHIVSYLSTTIITMYENNISQHFIEHVSRAWNVIFHKDVKVKDAPTTEAQQQIFDFCANIRDTILEGNGNSIKWTDIFQRPNLQQRLFISFAKSF